MLTKEKLEKFRQEMHESGRYDLLYSELEAIQAASNGSAFFIAAYAYAYGLHRGRALERNRRKQRTGGTSTTIRSTPEKSA